MSYCRWSCMDFSCDLYAYESADGYTIHVAGRRILGDVPPLPKRITMENVQEWLDARKAQSDYLETAEREDITLSHAGETFVEGDLDDFEARLLYLRGLGYRFPDYALEIIQEERSNEE